MASITSVSFMYNGGMLSCSWKNGTTMEYWMEASDRIRLGESLSQIRASPHDRATQSDGSGDYRHKSIAYQADTLSGDNFSNAWVDQDFKFPLPRPLQPRGSLGQFVVRISRVAHQFRRPLRKNFQKAR